MANGLNPTYQALYDAELPQLQLSVQQANQARGMFYSGQATDAQTKAEADLLAKLLAQQATDTQQTSLQQAQINQAQSSQEASAKAQSRATNMGLIGTGAAAGLGILGTKLMQQPVTNLFQDKSGNWNSYNPATKTSTPINMNGGGSGVGGATLQPGAAPGAGIGGPGTLPGLSDVGGGVTPSMGSFPGTVPSAGAADTSNLFSGGGSPSLSNLSPSMAADPMSVATQGLPSLTGDFSGAAGGFSADAPDLSSMPNIFSSGAPSAGAGLAADFSFAKGGIVTKPTIAQIGDAGPGNPEEVIPLNKLQGAIGPQGAARVMAAVPQPGSPGYGQPPAQPPAQPSMWSAPSAQGAVPPPAPMSPLAALQSGGLLGNLFNRPRAT